MPSACKRAHSLKVSRLDMNHPSGNTASTSLPPDPPKFGDAEQHGCDGPGRGTRFGLDVHKVVTCPSGLDEMWCWTRVLWQTVGVETIVLIIESRPDDKLLVAACSACAARFKLRGNTLGHKELLRKKFDIHCRGVRQYWKSRRRCEGQ